MEATPRAGQACTTAGAHLLFVYSCAASGLAGLAQLGSVSSDWMEVNIVHTLWHGDLQHEASTHSSTRLQRMCIEVSALAQSRISRQ